MSINKEYERRFTVTVGVANAYRTAVDFKEEMDNMYKCTLCPRHF